MPLIQEEEIMDVNRKEQLDKTYLLMAHQWGGTSRAVRLKVGCLVVKGGQIVSHGMNGTPYGMDNVCEALDNGGEVTPVKSVKEAERLRYFIEKDKSLSYRLVTRPEVVHAELNALLKMARMGVACEGATMYVTDSPCFECAKAIIQAGISRVVYDREYRITDGLDLLREAGVEVERIAL